MWKIQSEKNESTHYNFVAGETYVVGRKSCHILLVDDPSISRRHALLSVAHSEENLGDPSKVSVFKLKDESSKYGTFLNDVRFSANQEKELKDGDIIKFGQFSSVFRVSFIPLCITTSCVQPILKNELRKVITKLGGHIIPEWRPCCTHLLMSDIKVTVKALCCLLALKPIVKPEYLVELVKLYSKNLALPLVENFIPPIGEPLIDKEKAAFSVIQDRQKIFQNKTFVFFDEKQMKKLHLAINTAGANATLLSIDGAVDISFLTNPKTCVIQPFGDKMNDAQFCSFVKKVAVALQRRKKRLIPEADFGLAVAYCSTEKFCNPDFDVGNNLLSITKIASQTFSNAEVYVPDTDERERSLRQERLQKHLAEDRLNQPSTSRDTSISRTIEESEEVSSNKRKNYDIFDRTAKRKRNNDGTSSESDTKSSLDVVKTESPDSAVRVKVEPTSRHSSQEVSSGAMETVDIINTHTQQLNDITLKTDCPPHSLRSKSTTARENQEDEDLPRNLIKVTMVDLIKRNFSTAPAISHQRDGVINFKKFKKVSHLGSQALPRIIGGRDLISHSDAATTRAMDDWIRDNPEDEPVDSVEEHGEFDWESQSNNHRARGR